MSSEWPTTTLGSLTNWLSGGTPKKDVPSYWGGEIPWISASSMEGTQYSNSDLKITQEGLINGSKIAPKDSVLLLVRGSALHKKIPVGIATRDLAFNQDVKAISPKNKNLLPEFLLYWIMAQKDYFLESVVEFTGIGAGKLDTKRLQALPISLPPVTEQVEIVKFVGAIDDRITLLRASNTTLEAITQALFKSWFVDFDPVHAKQQGRTPEGMDAQTAALFPDSFEESELGMVPKGWSPVRLDSFVELAYGKALKAEARIAGDVPVYGSGGITGWHNAALVNQPSIVVGRKGTVGSLYWENRPFFPIDTVFYVKAEKPLTYVFQVLKSLGLSDMNTDAAVPGLNRENAYRLLVAGASEEVIKAFDSIASDLRMSVVHNLRQIETLESTRDTLLPRLISGQLRLPEAQALVEATVDA